MNAYATIDDSRLQYIERNQDRLRADLYNGLQDVLHPHDLPQNLPAGAQADPLRDQQLGRRVILPSSYSRGPRHYSALYQNAMSLVQLFQKPTLFTTFTANPGWKEVQDELYDGQTPNDRPDLICDAFFYKFRSLLHDIDNGCFGPVQGKVWVIEYQKRGLPHAHLVVWLENRNDFLIPENVDRIVSAQLPGPGSDPLLVEAVKKFMIHGPCGH